MVTSRPLVDPPPLVEARSRDLAALAGELERRGCRKVGIEGGGQLIRGMIGIGKLDVLLAIADDPLDQRLCAERFEPLVAPAEP